ncbi:unnamed protein product [Urochloa humidicola]
MRRSVCGYGNGQQQPDMNMNYHRTHSEHVTKFAGNPCHIAGAGAVQHHTAVHKESFKEVDGTDCYDPLRGHHQQQLQAHRHHGYNNNNHGHGGRHSGGGSHRYETYEETYEESCEEETYSAGRHHGHGHGHGGGGRRYEYETYEETRYEEEEEVVGGGGYAQLKRGHRCA